MRKIALLVLFPSIASAFCTPPVMGNNTFLNSAAQAQFDQCLSQEQYQQQQLLNQQQQLNIQSQQLRAQQQLQQQPIVQPQSGNQPYQMPLFMRP